MTRGYTREVQSRFGGPQGVHPPRTAGPLARAGGGPGGDLAAGPGGQPRARRRPALRGREARGPATPATSGPRAASPTRSWPPAGARASDPIRPRRSRRSPSRAPTRDRRLGRSGHRRRGRPAGWPLVAVVLAAAVLLAGCTSSGDGDLHAVRHHPPGARTRAQSTRSRCRTSAAWARCWWTAGNHPLPVRDRPPGHAVPLLRHLRRPVAAAPLPPGWRAGRRDRASSPGCSAPPPGPTGPPRSPTTGGRCTCGRRTGRRARPPARR